MGHTSVFTRAKLNFISINRGTTIKLFIHKPHDYTKIHNQQIRVSHPGRLDFCDSGPHLGNQVESTSCRTSHIYVPKLCCISMVAWLEACKTGQGFNDWCTLFFINKNSWDMDRLLRAMVKAEPKEFPIYSLQLFIFYIYFVSKFQ